MPPGLAHFDELAQARPPHPPRRSDNTIDVNTTFSWEALDAEVVKLGVQHHERDQFAHLPLAAEQESPGSPDGARVLVTVSRKAEPFPEDTEWKQRESNPQFASPLPRETRPGTIRGITSWGEHGLHAAVNDADGGAIAPRELEEGIVLVEGAAHLRSRPMATFSPKGSDSV